MVQFRHVIVQLALAIDKRKEAGYDIFGQFSYFCPFEVFFFQNFYFVQILQVL